MIEKKSPTGCVCDEIYGVSHSHCEPSSGYICRLKAAGRQQPYFRLNGSEIDFESAIEVACRMLRRARYPLITGLDVLGTRSQQLAVDVGREIRAIIDVGLDEGCHSPTLSMAREGAVTATIGEVSRANGLVLVLGCDPAKTHPRFFQALMNGREAERLMVIGLPNNHSILDRGRFLQVAEFDLEVFVMILESVCRRQSYRSECLPMSVTSGDVDHLAQRILAEQHLLVLMGGDTSAALDEFNSLPDSVLSLVKSLSRFLRAITINLRSDRNGLGAENVLAWSTGFPFAVDATREVARSFGREHSAKSVLSRGEADAWMCFGVDSRGIDMLNPPFQQRINSLPQLHFIVDGNDEQVNLNHGGPDKLQIGNLSVLDDDFTRLDEVAFTVADDSSSGDPCQRLTLRKFLGRLLSGLRSQARPPDR